MITVMDGKKFLTIKDVANLLNLPLVTIERWEHQGKIPFKILKQKKWFKRKEILDWAQSHDFVIKSQKNKIDTKAKNLLSQAIEWGGIYYNMAGEDVYSVFENALDTFDFITKIGKDKILDDLLNREEFASTGVGNGIAIPHPRNRMKVGEHDTYVPVVFLENAIEYNSIDTIPVQVLFMIFTTDTKIHLQILSKISYCLKNNSLLSILFDKNKDKNLLQKINQIENTL